MFKKTVKASITITEWLIFAALILVVVVIVSPSLEIEGIPRSFIVTSGSMEPTVKTGSLVFTEKIAPQNLKEQDIITFKSPKDPKDTILHRINQIKSKDPLVFITKGDNNNAPDNWVVKGSDVYGRQVAVIPYLGRAGAFIRKPYGFALVIGLPALIFVISQIFAIKKAIKEEIEKKLAQKLKDHEAGIKDNKKTDPDTKTIILNIVVLVCFSVTALVETAALTKATFVDTVPTRGMVFATGDFVPPETPQLALLDTTKIITTAAKTSFRLFSLASTNEILNTNINTLTLSWSKVTDFNNTNKIYYDLQFALNPNFKPVNREFNNLQETNLKDIAFADGHYYARIRACDVLENCSEYSQMQEFIIDTKLPLASIDVVKESEKQKVFLTITDDYLKSYQFSIKNSEKTFKEGFVETSEPVNNLKIYDISNLEIPDSGLEIGISAFDVAGNISTSSSNIKIESTSAENLISFSTTQVSSDTSNAIETDTAPFINTTEQSSTTVPEVVNTILPTTEPVNTGNTNLDPIINSTANENIGDTTTENSNDHLVINFGFSKDQDNITDDKLGSCNIEVDEKQDLYINFNKTRGYRKIKIDLESTADSEYNIAYSIESSKSDSNLEIKDTYSAYKFNIEHAATYKADLSLISVDDSIVAVAGNKSDCTIKVNAKKADNGTDNSGNLPTDTTEPQLYPTPTPSDNNPTPIIDKPNEDSNPSSQPQPAQTETTTESQSNKESQTGNNTNSDGVSTNSNTSGSSSQSEEKPAEEVTVQSSNTSDETNK